MTINITFANVLPWILFALTLAGYIWTASSINSKLDYLLQRDSEERIFLLSKMNENYLIKPSPTTTDTIP
jgi:hypothetical protein